MGGSCCLKEKGYKQKFVFTPTFTPPNDTHPVPTAVKMFIFKDGTECTETTTPSKDCFLTHYHFRTQFGGTSTFGVHEATRDNALNELKEHHRKVFDKYQECLAKVFRGEQCDWNLYNQTENNDEQEPSQTNA